MTVNRLKNRAKKPPGGGGRPLAPIVKTEWSDCLQIGD